MKIWYLLLTGVVLIVGCAQKETAMTSATQAAIATAPSNSYATGCWFVVSDGGGHQGYQAADFGNSSATPQTQPLFKSIDDLRVALHRQGVTNVETIPGYTNGGWEIRGLTADELRALQ